MDVHFSRGKTRNCPQTAKNIGNLPPTWERIYVTGQGCLKAQPFGFFNKFQKKDEVQGTITKELAQSKKPYHKGLGSKTETKG